MVQGEKEERDVNGKIRPQKGRLSNGELLHDVRRLREWEREFGSSVGERERRISRGRGRSRRRRNGGKGRLTAVIVRGVLILLVIAGLLYAGFKFYPRVSGSGQPVTPLESSREIRHETMGVYQ